jgi:hypothetical protein
VAKKWLKKYLPNPEQIRAKKSFLVLGTLMHDPNLWHLNRHSVAGAVAIGLFFCYIPVPLQMLPAAIFAIIFRVNLAVSVTTVWVSNPFTIPPMFYFAYVVGAWLLGVEPQIFHFEFSLNWIFTELGVRWRPFLLGCMVLATLGSISGYFATHFLWRLHLVQRIKQRKLLNLLRKKDPDS